MQTFEAEWEDVRLVLQAADEKYRAERLRPNPDWPLRGHDAQKLKRAAEDACRLYLGATDSERSAMREFVSTTYTICPLLLIVLSESGRRLSESGDSKWLGLALSAASLENLTLDYRDSYIAVGSLYIKALEVGLDPSPAFQKAAEWSTADKANGGSSTRDFFTRFEQSAYFAESVARRAEILRSGSHVKPGPTHC